MPFKRDLACQNIPLSKQPFKMQPQIENEDVTWSPQYNLPTTRTNNRRALSLQKVELDGWSLILHIILETCTIWFMHKFIISFVFHFYILRLTSWIWTNLSTEEPKFESPSKWNSHEGFNLDHWRFWLIITHNSPQTMFRLRCHITFNFFLPEFSLNVWGSVYIGVRVQETWGWEI